MTDIERLYNIYVTNIARFPALYEALAEQLGVSTESVYKLGVGLIPCDDYGNWSWVWPERNAKGKVIGLNRRFTNGKKLMVSGSKRGLIYAVHHDTSKYERPHGWARVSKEHPCPICGKPDGCLYPKGEYHNPNAVICVHIKTGSTKPMELGYLHILDLARHKLIMQNYSILTPSEHPTLVVEGSSDVCAAYDLGFVGVGKPSAASKSQDLIDLLSGRRVVVMGENDAGAGRAGMESTFAQLQTKCPDCIKLMPPEGVKDLRDWVSKGLTKKGLLNHIIKWGDQTLSDDIFESGEARIVAKTWVKKMKTINGRPILGTYRDNFVEFNGCAYEDAPKTRIKAQIYNDIGGKRYKDGTGEIRNYTLTARIVRDILDALPAESLIEQEPPCWLVPGNHPDPSKLIVFQNGILNIDEYIAGKVILHPPTPDLFTFHVLPYAFNENAESELWEKLHIDIFEGDEERMLLLQQWFGLNLVADMSKEKFMVFKGPTRAGKGTVIFALDGMLGDNLGMSDFQLLATQFGFSSLQKKLAVAIGDAVAVTEKQQHLVMAKLLKIVGRDGVNINAKRQDHLPKVYLSCRFTFAMNDFFKMIDNSTGLAERTLILPFKKSFADCVDDTLKDRLKKEASEGKLINWALRGLRSLYASGKFIEPTESKLAMRAFKQLTAPVPYFVQCCLEEDIEGPGVQTDYLWALWCWWCRREGLTRDDKSTLIRNTQSVLHDTIQILDGEVGNPDRMLMGIKVTEWAEKSFAQG